MAQAWGFQIPLARCCALPRLDDPVSLPLILRKPRNSGNLDPTINRFPGSSSSLTPSKTRTLLPRFALRAPASVGSTTDYSDASPKRGSVHPLGRVTAKSYIRAMASLTWGFNNFYMRRRDTTGYEIDEALWEAYRRYDKSAVMNRLISRYLPALAFAAKTKSTFARANELTNLSGNRPAPRNLS